MRRHAPVRTPDLGAQIGGLFVGAVFGGDVALQEAMRWADAAEARPNEKAAYLRAEIWRPHRGVAAHLLWAWYGGVKRGEIVLEDAA